MQNEINSRQVPVTIVAGFLGAGKTTLLNHILNGDHGEKIAVIVNDFGAVNIDAELISDVNEGMVSLANGCICCAIRTDLISAVLKLANGPEQPDHIIIESSGVARPGSLTRAFSEHDIRNDVILAGTISVVDAEQISNLSIENEKLIKEQIREGDLLILNKTDLVSAAELTEAVKEVSKIRSGVSIIETSYCNIPMDVVLGLEHKPNQHSIDKSVHHNHNHDTHTDHFETFTFHSHKPFIMGVFHQIIKHLPNTVYRVKGIVYFAEKTFRRHIFQMVGRRATVAVGEYWEDGTPQTNLVFIAKKGTVNFEEIGKALEACTTVFDDCDC